MPVPVSSPRSVSMIGVNGWYSANQRSPVGIESAGTKPLPRNGRNTSGMGRLLAASTLLVTRPSATESQVSANATTASTTERGQPLDRTGVRPEPDGSADTPSTTTDADQRLTTLPTTCPVRTDDRAIAMVRNRAMIPSVMSIATEMAVPWAADAAVISRMPGAT